MQSTLCSRCHKNVAVVFISKIEGGATRNEGLCLKCAKELGIKPINDMIQKMGISDEDLENLTNEMMSAFGGAEGMEGLVPQGVAHEEAVGDCVHPREGKGQHGSSGTHKILPRRSKPTVPGNQYPKAPLFLQKRRLNHRISPSSPSLISSSSLGTAETVTWAS